MFVRIEQVFILERRNSAGKVLYKPLVGGWNGNEDDKHKLLEELDRLQKDPSILNYDAILPELNNEFASVNLSGFPFHVYDKMISSDLYTFLSRVRISGAVYVLRKE